MNMSLLFEVIKLFKSKTEYIDWEIYKKKIDCISHFEWQKRVRERNTHY